MKKRQVLSTTLLVDERITVRRWVKRQMKMSQFETKVRKDMFRSSILTIFIMVGITLILFGLHSVNVRKARLEQTADTYTSYLRDTMDSYQEDLFETHEDTFRSYFNQELDRNQVFSAFYAFNSNQEMKSELLLIDDAGEVQLSTDSILEEDHAFLHYASIVMRHVEENEDSMGKRVYRALNGEQYLLLFYPFRENGATEGFGISVINGRETQAFQLDASVSFIIFDQFNNIFATNTPRTIQNNRGKVDFEVFEGENGVLGNPYEVVQQSITDNLSVMTYQQFDGYVTVLYRSIIGILIMTSVVIVQSYYFSKKVSEKTGNSLQIIYEEMEKVKQDATHLLAVQTEDEFEVLAEQINQMLGELSRVNSEYVQLNQLNMETQKRKLDAQFNPHFLANTLEAIRSVMYMDPDIASHLILKMNKILRYSIDEEMNDITLKEDIEYVRDYLEINATRLEEFDYKIEMDPILESFVVPKLFLLPFIENSLKYGYKKRRDLKVHIQIKYREDHTIVFRVVDNGGAITHQEAQSVNDSLQKPNEWINHHGLKNTKQRVELFYPQSSFRLYRKLSCTVVELVIRSEG